MQAKAFPFAGSTIKWLVAVFAIVVVVAAGAFSRDLWLPGVNQFIASFHGASPEGHAKEGEAETSHAEDHNHAGHDESDSIHISEQGKKNIKLKTEQIKLQPFQRTITIPALVVERAGRSQVVVTAPLGGRVTRVHVIEGEAVVPGQKLFDLRLTHEELVNAQGEFLSATKQLDVLDKEIKRLASVSIPGAIPGKTIRARNYEKEKLQATISAQEQSLMLHGLSAEQVQQIRKTGELLQSITVLTPPFPPDGHEDLPDHPFVVQRLNVKPGQYVDAGESLCLLSDHHELYLEGSAFEQDTESLAKAMQMDWPIRAVPLSERNESNPIEALKILYLSDAIDKTSRAFHFYVRLPNESVRDITAASGHRFFTWRYKPGQRMQLRVPVEKWEDQIVLPIDALVKDGVEYYLFQQNGDHFDRIPVHVLFQDQHWAVIANDGSVFPGATVVTRGAHDLQMDLKNKSGGAVDPHAGHNH